MLNKSVEENAVNVERLREIKDEIKDLLAEAHDLLKSAEGIIQERAESYWLAHVREALDDDHPYLGGSMCTMQDTIDEIEEGPEEE